MNILVTGANGYLGAYVCYQLRQRGHLVFPMDSHGHFLQHVPDYRIIDMVAHLAWFSKAGNDNPKAQVDCIKATLDLIEFCIYQCPLPRMVFTSTASVYLASTNPTFPLTEASIVEPSCAYTKAKVGAENLIRRLLPKSHLILRLGSLMGRGSTPNGRTKIDVVVNAFASDAYRTGKIAVWHPEAWKPILHVQDAARIVVEGLERREWVGTVNAASSCLKAIDIARVVAHQTGAEIQVVERPGPVRSHRIDCSLLQRGLTGTSSSTDVGLPGLGFYTLEEAIREFSDYEPGPRDVTVPW